MIIGEGCASCPDFKPRELLRPAIARSIHHKKKASPGAQSILKLDEASAGFSELKGLIASGREARMRA